MAVAVEEVGEAIHCSTLSFFVLFQWDVGCGMWDVGCGMWDVGCGMWDVGCGMWVVGVGCWSVDWGCFGQENEELRKNNQVGNK